MALSGLKHLYLHICNGSKDCFTIIYQNLTIPVLLWDESQQSKLTTQACYDSYIPEYNIVSCNQHPTIRLLRIWIGAQNHDMVVWTLWFIIPPILMRTNDPQRSMKMESWRTTALTYHHSYGSWELQHHDWRCLLVFHRAGCGLRMKSPPSNHTVQGSPTHMMSWNVLRVHKFDNALKSYSLQICSTLQSCLNDNDRITIRFSAMDCLCCIILLPFTGQNDWA